MHSSPFTWRGSAAAVLIACSIFAVGCSQSSEYTDTTDAPPAAAKSAKGTSPAWVSKGFQIATRYRESLKASAVGSGSGGSTPTTVATSDQLPPKDQFVATLSGLGLGASAAGCIYDGVNGTPLAAKLGGLISAAGAATGTASPAAALSGATGLAGIDEGTVKQILVALAPCVDSTTLVALLAASGGLGSGTGAASLTGLLGSAVASAASSAGGGTGAKLDVSALAKAAGSSFNPAQLAALSAALNQGVAGELSKLDPRTADLSKLDLSKLTPDKINLLLAAILRGLTPQQQSDLRTLTKVNLDQLNVQVDTSKLTSEQVGSLLLLLLPYISAGISPVNGTPPPGVDPGKIYVPPGVDLSNINPINFLSKPDFILGLNRQGVGTPLAGCLYEKLRLVDPQLIAIAFAGTDLTAVSQISLAVLGCVLNPNG